MDSSVDLLSTKIYGRNLAPTKMIRSFVVRVVTTEDTQVV